MFARSVRLTRVAAIDVRLDSSLLLFAAIIAWIFGASFLVRHALLVTVPMAVSATVLFLASVLAHELAHGLEARYRGIRVHGITLFFFGGMTEMRADSRGPRDEFAISAVGPYASLVCAAVFGLIATFAPVLGGSLGAPIADVSGLLAWLNLFLAAFNLVPGAPLDGGRVLRAGLWWLLDDRHRAVRISARAGQTLAVGLVVLGLGGLLVGLGVVAAPGADAPTIVRTADSPVFGIVLLMVGAFIFQTARAELTQGELEQVLDRRRVAELVVEAVPPLERDRLLDLVDPGSGDRLLPVVEGSQVVGVLRSERVRSLHPADRAARTAGELMDPASDLTEVEQDAPLRELVDRFLDGSEHVVVRAQGRPVAVLRQSEVARGLRRLRRARGDGRAAAAQTQGSAT